MKKDRTGQVTVRLMKARDIPASARQRLHLADDDTQLVEVYEYHRPEHERVNRQQIASLLAALEDAT